MHREGQVSVGEVHPLLRDGGGAGDDDTDNDDDDVSNNDNDCAVLHV